MKQPFSLSLLVICLCACSGQSSMRAPRPGSVEAMIQRLGDPDVPETRKVADVDQITAKGKAAMGALIANVANKTASLSETGPDGKSAVTTVGYQCRQILKFLIQPDETDMFQQWEPKDWPAWWEANKGKRLETILAEVAALKRSAK